MRSIVAFLLIGTISTTLSLPSGKTISSTTVNGHHHQSFHEGNSDSEYDDNTSRKIIGSSVSTSVSVILNGEKPAHFSDAIGKPVPRPLVPPQVASPINLLNPDRYEFYTFNDNGDLVKRLMTMKEIQSIVAGGASEGTMLLHNSPSSALSASSSSSIIDPQQNLDNNVQDIVNNVQRVLNNEVELKKNSTNLNQTHQLDTPDVSSTWSMILPAIFGNTGDAIRPHILSKPQHTAMTPDAILMDITTTTTKKPSSLAQQKKPISVSSGTINQIIDETNKPQQYKPILNDNNNNLGNIPIEGSTPRNTIAGYTEHSLDVNIGTNINDNSHNNLLIPSSSSFSSSSGTSPSTIRITTPSNIHITTPTPSRFVTRRPPTKTTPKPHTTTTTKITTSADLMNAEKPSIIVNTQTEYLSSLITKKPQNDDYLIKLNSTNLLPHTENKVVSSTTSTTEKITDATLSMPPIMQTEIPVVVATLSNQQINKISTTFPVSIMQEEKTDIKTTTEQVKESSSSSESLSILQEEKSVVSPTTEMIKQSSSYPITITQTQKTDMSSTSTNEKVNEISSTTTAPIIHKDTTVLSVATATTTSNTTTTTTTTEKAKETSTSSPTSLQTEKIATLSIPQKIQAPSTPSAIKPQIILSSTTTEMANSIEPMTELPMLLPTTSQEQLNDIETTQTTNFDEEKLPTTTTTGLSSIMDDLQKAVQQMAMNMVNDNSLKQQLNQITSPSNEVNKVSKKEDEKLMETIENSNEKILINELTTINDEDLLSITTTTTPSSSETKFTMSNEEDLFDSTSSFNQILESLKEDLSTEQIDMMILNKTFNNNDDNDDSSTTDTKTLIDTTTFIEDEQIASTLPSNIMLQPDHSERINQSNVYKSEIMYVDEPEPNVYDIPTTTEILFMSTNVDGDNKISYEALTMEKLPEIDNDVTGNDDQQINDITTQISSLETSDDDDDKTNKLETISQIKPTTATTSAANDANDDDDESNKVSYETSIVKKTSSVSVVSGGNPLVNKFESPQIKVNLILPPDSYTSDISTEISIESDVHEEMNEMNEKSEPLASSSSSSSSSSSTASPASPATESSSAEQSIINFATGILDSIGVFDEEVVKLHLNKKGEYEFETPSLKNDETITEQVPTTDVTMIMITNDTNSSEDLTTVTSFTLPTEAIELNKDDTTSSAEEIAITTESSSLMTTDFIINKTSEEINTPDFSTSTISENNDLMPQTTEQQNADISITDQTTIADMFTISNQEELESTTYKESLIDDKISSITEEELEMNDQQITTTDKLDVMEKQQELITTNESFTETNMKTDSIEPNEATTTFNYVNTNPPEEHTYVKLGETTIPPITPPEIVLVSSTASPSTTVLPVIESSSTVTMVATNNNINNKKPATLKIDDIKKLPPHHQQINDNEANNQDDDDDNEQIQPKPIIKMPPSFSSFKIKQQTNLNRRPIPAVNLDPAPKQSLGLEESTLRASEDILEFAKLCNELAFTFWRSLTSEGISSARSLVFSPFALTSMLAMVFLGARGSTSGEMNELLRLDDMVTFNPHLIFRNITDSVEDPKGAGLANSAFVRELFADRNKGKILSFFKEKSQQYYSAHVEEVNFNLINDIVRRRTNLLVKRHTFGKINEYLKTNNLWLNAPLAGLSANIFQTDCSKAFVNERDGEMFFQVLPAIRQRRLVPIPAVVWKSGFTAGYDPELDVTAVAFGGSTNIVSTIFVMPGQQGHVAAGDNLQRVESMLMANAMTKNAWRRLLTTLMDRPGLEVQIPRFSHRSFVNATVGLQRMGLNKLFDFDNADLRGLTGSTTRDLFISDMVQVNTFSTCGEDKINDQHHIEMYPAPPIQHRNIHNYDEDSFASDYEDDELGLPAESIAEKNEEDRSFYDPLFDEQYLTLPLPLRPRQARIPEAPRLRFDKPFLFFVRHNPTGMILYMGRFNPRLLP